MKRIRDLIRSNQAGGWADQMVVSAANLMMLLMVARWSSVSELGYYAIAFSVLMLAISAQDSLVTRPYAVQMFKLQGKAAHHAAGSLLFAMVLAASFAVLAGVVAAVLWLLGGEGSGLRLAATLALALPPIMLREFVRRFCFAHLRAWQAFATDMVAALIATFGILCLAHFGILSAATAVLALAAACGVAAAVWLLNRRAEFIFDLSATKDVVARSIALGKWLLSGQLAMQAQGYAAHWITLAIGGAVTTGLYSACLSIVALSNPFLFGYFNLLTPKFVRILKEGGNGALLRHAARGSLFLAGVIGSFVLFLALYGEWILGIMFPGDVYRQASDILTVLGLATLAGALGGPAGVALTAAEKGRPIAAISVGTCLLGSALVAFLMAGWGLEAASIGILATEVLGSLGRWALAICLLTRERRSLAATPPRAVTL